MKHYSEIITINPEIRFGKPCIRGMRITVYDILSWLASGMTSIEILEDYPELTDEDIKATLAYAADREHKIKVASWNCCLIKISHFGLFYRFAIISQRLNMSGISNFNLLLTEKFGHMQKTMNTILWHWTRTFMILWHFKAILPKLSGCDLEIHKVSI